MKIRKRTRIRVSAVKPYFPEVDIETIKDDVETILRSGMLSSTNGHYVTEFEKDFGRLCKTKSSIAVSSGTAALEAVLGSLKLKSGDKVIVPTNTFSASVSSIIRTGGTPLLADIDPKTLCINFKDIDSDLPVCVRAIMVVHIGGIVCPDILKLKAFTSENNIKLIEDCAHAHGSKYGKHFAGSIGYAGCFSFYPTKIMTTGEGGMITTNSSLVSDFIETLRDQGRTKHESVIIKELGHNLRMSEINAAIGLVQLSRLDEIISKKKKIAEFYDNKLKNVNGITLFKIPEKCTSNYYKYILFLDKDIERDYTKARLLYYGIQCPSEVYDPPVHLQPVYMRLLKTKKGDFPIAEEAAKRMLCLPIYPSISRIQMEYVTEKLKEILQ